MHPRRRPPALVSALVLLPLLTLLAACSSTPEYKASGERTDKRPNIVVVMTDDQTLEDMQFLPKTKELIGGQNGTTFANSFVSFPLCCPSRATFLTGQYAHNNGVQNNVPPTKNQPGPPGGNDALNHDETLPVWLQRSGYNTAHVGKYLNGYGEESPAVVPPGYTDWFGLIDPSVLNFYDYDVLDNGNVVHYGTEEKDYQTDVLSQRAASDVRRFATEDKPFYLTVWTLAPHSGTGKDVPNPLSPAPAPKYKGKLADRTWPRPESFMEDDLSDKPPAVQAVRGKIDEGLEQLGMSQEDLADFIDETWRARGESLYSVDDLVENLTTTLRDTGQLDNTIVVFTSDNGWLLGEHNMPFAKVVLYEESIRVPLLVRGPGFPAGATVTQPVANVDLAPTFLAAGRASAGIPVDGHDIQPFTASKDEGRNRAILLEEYSHKPTYKGVRVAGYMYAEYSDGAAELYDLLKDPHQLDSVAGDPAYAKTQARLAQALHELQDCSGPACQVDVPQAELRG